MAKDANTTPARGPRSGRGANRCKSCGAPLRKAGDFCPRCGAASFSPDDLVPATVAATFKERWLPIFFIAALVFIAYLPSLDNGFVSWDDDHYIYKNHQVHYPDGIDSIWTDVFKHGDKKFQGDGRTEDRVSHQYYPMVFTIYWLEFRLYKWFGSANEYLTIEENIDRGHMNAFLFHLDSVLLHMVNVMLLVFCFRQLGASNWVAWAATILFALHPMHAATVAWAAERKNIISLMFYLLALMSYIKLRRDGKWWRYLLAIVLYQAALFSKTVSLTFPIVLFLTDRLLERRWDKHLILVSLVRIAPFVMMSGIAAWTTIHVEDRQRTIPIEPGQRPLLPAAALLWYPGTMLFPVNLSPVYSLWPIDPTEIVWFLPTLGVLALAVLVIVFRRKLGPYFMWGLLFYCVTQGPMLGLKNINFFQFAFVADHYFYHGAVGLALMIAVGLDALRRRVQPPARGQKVATGVVMAIALAWGACTMSYVHVWKDAESFWKHILERHPSCWPGWYNTGNARKRQAIALKQRLLKPTLTDEERTKLRAQAAALRAEVEQGTLGDAQCRRKILEANELEDQSNWPDLTPEEVTQKKKEMEELFDDAAERYKKVKEIHKQISQPYDQWISVRQIEGDWCAAYEAANEAAHRFPSLTDYFDKAGEFAFYCGKYEESHDVYAQGAKIWEKRRQLDKAAFSYFKAGLSAVKAEQIAEAVANFIKSGRIQLGRGDRLIAKNRHCAALKTYEEAAKAFTNAVRLDNASQEAQSALATANAKIESAKPLCPQASK